MLGVLGATGGFGGGGGTKGCDEAAPPPPMAASAFAASECAWSRPGTAFSGLDAAEATPVDEEEPPADDGRGGGSVGKEKAWRKLQRWP